MEGKESEKGAGEGEPGPLQPHAPFRVVNLPPLQHPDPARRRYSIWPFLHQMMSVCMKFAVDLVFRMTLGLKKPDWCSGGVTVRAGPGVGGHGWVVVTAAGDKAVKSWKSWVPAEAG